MRSQDWKLALTVRCPSCHAQRLSLCVWHGKTMGREDIHARRLEAAIKIEHEAQAIERATGSVPRYA